MFEEAVFPNLQDDSASVNGIVDTHISADLSVRLEVGENDDNEIEKQPVEPVEYVAEYANLLDIEGPRTSLVSGSTPSQSYPLSAITPLSHTPKPNPCRSVSN